MTYLRNITAVDQWLVDQYTGVSRRISAGSLTRVKREIADTLVRDDPARWEKVDVISL